MKNIEICNLEINGQERRISCGTTWTSTSYYLYVDEDLVEIVKRKPYQDMRGGLCYAFSIDGEEVKFLVQSELTSIVYNGIEHKYNGKKSIYREKVEIPVWLARTFTIVSVVCLFGEWVLPGWVWFVILTAIWYAFLYFVNVKFKYTIPICIAYIIIIFGGIILGTLL